MCDGPMNHFHIQLIPRYSYERRGSKNFVKERKEYIEDKEKIAKIRKLLSDYSFLNINLLLPCIISNFLSKVLIRIYL